MDNLDNFEVAYASADDWQRIVETVRREALGAGKRLVIVAPSRRRVLTLRRVLAGRGAGFGLTVTTLRDWTDDLWALFGDGRTPVSADERTIAMLQAIDAQDGIAATPGMVDLLCRAADEALPYASRTEQLSENEKTAAAVLQTYRDLLVQANRCAYSEMLQLLMAEPALQGYLPVAMARPDDFTVLEQRFLHAAGARFAVRALNAEDGAPRATELDQLLHMVFNRTAGEAPVTATGHVRLAFASGPEAQRRSVHNAVEAALDRGCRTMTVVVPDALDQFAFSAPLLQKRGAVCTVRARKPFADTDAGRTLLDLCAMTGPGHPDAMLDADYAFNPFSGIWFGTAFYTDMRHRGDRLIDNSEVLTDLAGHAADELQGVIGLVEEDDVEGAIELLTAWAAAHLSIDAGYLAEQLAALAAAQRAIEAAKQWGTPQRRAVAALQDASVTVNVRTCPTDEAGSGPEQLPAVAFLTMADAAEAAPASVDAVVVGKLNAADYSLKQADDSLATLLGKWGLHEQPDVWGRARRQFYAVLQSARDLVVLQRATHNETADETQAAAVFEETVACYQADPASRDDIDRAWGVPQQLVPYAVLGGEEDLVANATGTGSTQLLQEQAPVIGSITAEARPFIVLSRPRKDGEPAGMDLSASQIESYLECPYQWFAKRRLKLETIDEQFSPAERGTFMHAILEHFYKRFQLEVAPKVTAQNLDRARAIMTEVFHEQAERQFTDTKLKKGSRYVPVNAQEEKQRDHLLDQLLDYLGYETELLPAFQPWKLEWGYGEPQPFSYAGCNLVGRIDRIDIDDAGNAVVIDYKSSLSPAYRLHLDPQGREAKKQRAEREKAREAYRAENGGLEPPEEERTLELPAKMQALIYAKAVRDYLGCRVVASIYLNPLTRAIQGAYDARMIGPDQLPFAKAADLRCAAVPCEGADTFDELIDGCEQVVAAHMARLARGDIAPAPHGEDACAYCPVGNCPKRLAKRKR